MRSPLLTLPLLALLGGVAPAAEIDPGQQQNALMLLLNGLPGSANESTMSPKIAVVVAGMDVTLETTTLGEIAAKLGGEINTAGESENSFAWMCYASPDVTTGGTTLTWFYGNDTNQMLLTGIAVEFAPDELPAGCVRVEKPIGVTTGLPGLGAPVADLDGVFGKATADSGIPGTVSYMFGSTRMGDGYVFRNEAKYVLGDTHVLAFSFRTVVEEE